MRLRLPLTLLAVAILVLAGCKTSPIPNNRLFLEDAPPDRLFIELSRMPSWIGQSRIARLNEAQFFDRAYEPSSGEVTIFNLFDDVQLAVTSKDYLGVGSGTTIWHGQVNNEEVLRIALAVVGREITGEILTLSETIRITALGNGWHRIDRIAPGQLPVEGEPIEVSSEGLDAENVLANCDEADETRPPPGPGRGARVRLLLAYTPAAVAAIGNINVFSDLLLDQLTQIWTDSENFAVYPELALVTQVSYTESGRSLTDLTRLQGRRDGFMDELHTLRNSSGADLVALINVASDVCGIAYYNYPPSRQNANYGFSVTNESCALGGLTLAHELGHNFSMQHDRYVSRSRSDRYNYGYSNLMLRVRDVMAYTNECGSRGFYCQRIPSYSHPYLFIRNERLGVPIGSSGAAHNRNMLCVAANAVSRYR